MRRVDRERGQHRPDPLGEERGHLVALVGVELLPAQQVDALVVERGRAPARGTRAACRCISSLDSRQIASSSSPGFMPLEALTATPASIRRFRPATRTMKNSSRLLAKMARNRARSSSGRSGSSASSSTRLLNLQPGELAVEEPVVRQVVVVRPVRRLDVEGVVRRGQPGYGVRALVERPGGGGGQVGRPGGDAAVGLRLRGHDAMVSPAGERRVARRRPAVRSVAARPCVRRGSVGWRT